MHQKLATAFVLTAFVIHARADELSPVYNAALEGDMVKAFSILDSIESNRLSSAETVAADCIRKTFVERPKVESLPPVSQKILTAYRHYWQTAMLRRATTKDAEAELLASLNTILAGSATNLDDASDRAKVTIEKDGLFALTGVTSPYYELMIWKTQSPQTYRVRLTDRTINVRVVFLDDFVSLGWAGYATCGRSHSGGWATTNELIALKSAYKIDSEDFHVGYLAHEGRHFADYKLFPKLEQPELEYRAKLTEIALSKDTTHKLVAMFAQRNGRDRSVPHHFANYWVARDLSRLVFKSNEVVDDASKWERVPAGKLRSEAKRLLKENTAALQRVGATSVETFLAN